MIDNVYMHYVVVYGVQDNLLLIADPENGKLKKSIENFCKEWTGVLLLMTPNVNYQPKRESCRSKYLCAYVLARKIFDFSYRVSFFIYQFIWYREFILFSRYFRLFYSIQSVVPPEHRLNWFDYYLSFSNSIRVYP